MGTIRPAVTGVICVTGTVLLMACSEDLTAPIDAPPSAATTIEDAAFSAALGDGEGEDMALASFEMPLEPAAEEDVEADLDIGGDYARDCSLDGFKARVVGAFDHDHDGELGRGEYRELLERFGIRPLLRHRFLRHHRVARLYWIYDADDSGDLDEDELAELRADIELRCFNRQAWLLETYDENGDGELDEDEWALAREDLRARRKERRAAIFDEFDENGDGRLDHEELRAAFAARREALAERRDAIVEEFDEDGDGELDAEEKAALREHLKSRVRGEYFVDGDDEQP